MMTAQEKRGLASIGLLADLDGVTAASVIYLRMWCDGPESQSEVVQDMCHLFGAQAGHKATQALQELCDLCTRHCRRPLMRHSIHCKCLGADEACFAHFIATAAEGEREDAMLMATLLVRPDVAPLLVALATEFGLALKRIALASARPQATNHPLHTTLH